MMFSLFLEGKIINEIEQMTMLKRYISLFTILILVHLTLARYTNNENSRMSKERSGFTRETSKLVPKTHVHIREKPPRTLEPKEGDSLELRCHAGGKPAPTIYWLKDGMRISQGEKEDRQGSSSIAPEEKLEISSTISRLVLGCISEKDTAQYRCVAENPYHTASTTTSIIVSQNPAGRRQCQTRAQLGRVPRIYMWTKTTFENQGQNTTFFCHANGYPIPIIRWKGPRGQELSTSDTSKYQILPIGDLVIQNLIWSDMGSYKCIAENVHGKDETETFLYPARPDK